MTLPSSNRVGPADAVCRWVRDRLFDHAAGLLAPRARCVIDEHVHVCRRCALELSRAEFDVLWIRRTIAQACAAARAPRPTSADRRIPPGFTHAVMERVRRECVSVTAWQRLVAGGLRIIRHWRSTRS